VARAAMESGVARREITDWEGYRNQLAARRDPTAGTFQNLFARLRQGPRTVVFAEGEEPQVIRAAATYVAQGLGRAVLVGREDAVREAARAAGVELKEGLTIQNARLSERTEAYAELLYARLQRSGYLQRDCHRLINTDRNHFAAAMVALGDADAMVSGLTRNYSVVLEDVRRVIDPKPGHAVIGISIVVAKGRTTFVADTAVHDMPSAAQLAQIAREAASFAQRLGHTPRVAFLAHSTFGHPPSERSERVREAVQLLGAEEVDFEFDGEMAADVALDPDLMALYPFCRLTGPANVLVMPAFHSASIGTKMVEQLGGSTVIGPVLVGLDKPVQIVGLGARDSDILNMAAFAAFGAEG